MTNLSPPIFSIITCTYNSQDYLEQNILSVKKQKFKNYEHIFIDGDSKDNTIELIQNYQKDYPEIVKLFTRTPKGISNAFNEGIKESNGKYLIHLNSDDSFFDNNVLQKAYNFLIANDKLDWIYGKICVINESGKSLGTFSNKSIFQNNSLSAVGKYILKFIKLYQGYNKFYFHYNLSPYYLKFLQSYRMLTHI